MDLDFYKEHNGHKCPDKLFSKDVRKIKGSLDQAMSKYGRSIKPEELEALFLTSNPTLTTAQKAQFSSLFTEMRKHDVMQHDVANDVLSKLFQQTLGEEIANIGFDFVNGQGTSLDPLRRILDNYSDDFTPSLKVDWLDMDMDNLLEMAELESRWKFNIPTVARHVSGINAGHLVEIGARPNTGKSSFHASIIAGPGGFVEQGASVVVLCNEEAQHRVGNRYITTSTGWPLGEVKANRDAALRLYMPTRKSVRIKDSTGEDMSYVESVCKTYKPDILVLDMGDKFVDKNGKFAREDQALKDCAIRARQVAKEYNTAVLYMSQLSAEAEGKILLNMSMMEGSRTGKAAEADLMLLIAGNPAVEGEEEMNNQRHITVAKNKLTGWHGIIHCEIDPETGRYTS